MSLNWILIYIGFQWLFEILSICDYNWDSTFRTLCGDVRLNWLLLFFYIFKCFHLATLLKQVCRRLVEVYAKKKIHIKKPRVISTRPVDLSFRFRAGVKSKNFSSSTIRHLTWRGVKKTPSHWVLTGTLMNSLTWSFIWR